MPKAEQHRSCIGAWQQLCLRLSSTEVVLVQGCSWKPISWAGESEATNNQGASVAGGMPPTGGAKAKVCSATPPRIVLKTADGARWRRRLNAPWADDKTVVQMVNLNTACSHVEPECCLCLQRAKIITREDLHSSDTGTS